MDVRDYLMKFRRFSWFGLALLITSSALGNEKPVPASKSTPMEKLQVQGFENVFRLSDRIFSGSSPESTNDLKHLQKLSVKTLISVDGAKPDADLARALGMKYIHIPVGYDGITPEQQLRLIKAARIFPHPIYIHCHHGQHRGPTAAAVLCMGNESWDKDKALLWMKTAGTATHYTGLFRTIQMLRLPSEEALQKESSHFPEKVEVSPMVDAMVLIDERMEHLKLVKDAGFKAPPSHPDIDPAHEALMLEEAFRELLRTPDTQKREPEFIKQMALAEGTSSRLRGQLAFPHDPHESIQTLTAIFKELSSQCTACHRSFRD